MKKIICFIIVILLLYVIINRIIKNTNDISAEFDTLNNYFITIGMVEIDYASNSRVIFHGYTYLFVYDIEEERIIKSLDLQAINRNYIQGDIYTEVIVSNDGNHVNLYNVGDENDRLIYNYDIKNDELSKHNKITIDEPYRIYLTGDVQPKGYKFNEGRYSPTICKLENGVLVYLYSEDLLLQNLQIVFLDEKNGTKKTYDIFN